MTDASLKSRAVVFALCAGGVAFLLALMVTAQATGTSQFARALIPAVVCGAFSWASAERVVSATAGALDKAIARLAQAGEGDLEGPLPPEIANAAPALARAMEALFRRLRASMDDIERLALYDPVTGLPNRLQMRARAEEALGAIGPDAPAALLFLDLDRFKAVNDTSGHAAGDQLLGQVAERLRAVVPGPDGLVGRLAGDEFVILLPGADAVAAARVSAALIDGFARPFEVAGAKLRVGASIGIALRPAHGRTLHDLMRAADAAMYQAKAGGRGQAELYTDALAVRLADRVRLDAQLRDAVGAREFGLVFQPQLSLRDGRLLAAEALLRWRHPSDGLRLPGSFLDRAEATGLIGPIGEGVVADVASAIARWAAAGRGERVCVNISRRQLDEPGFLERVSAALLAAGAPARLLELEIGEAAAVAADVDAIAALAAFRARGARVTLDGFGAGGSGPALLRALPIDRVKLARSLVARVADDEEARAVAQAMIALVHALGLEAVAEGVETAAQVDILRVIGCDAVQGYAVAPPMDEAAFLAWSAADPIAPVRAITSA